MDNAVTDTPTNVAGEELRQFIERFERLEAEKKDIADGQKKRKRTLKPMLEGMMKQLGNIFKNKRELDTNIVSMSLKMLYRSKII